MAGGAGGGSPPAPFYLIIFFGGALITISNFLHILTIFLIYLMNFSYQEQPITPPVSVGREMLRHFRFQHFCQWHDGFSFHAGRHFTLRLFQSRGQPSALNDTRQSISLTNLVPISNAGSRILLCDARVQAAI